MMAYAVHLKANAVLPSEAPDVHVHDGICNTPVGKYSTPSGAPDVLYMTVFTRLLMNMIGYAY